MTDGDFATLFIVVGGFAGLVIGSFLNVIIARVPDGLSIVHPGSSCPRCDQLIGARDNIPILSWLLLRGRCRTCRGSISVRYPLIEALTGVLWSLVAWWSLANARVDGWPISPLLPTLLIVVSACIALAFIDVDHQLLPRTLVWPLYPIVVVGLTFDGVAGGKWEVWRSLLGALLWLVVIGGVWFLSNGRAMGFGDVRLAPVLGGFLGWLGWGPALVGLLAAWIIGGLVAIILLVMRQVQAGRLIAFGPFLIGGFLCGVFAGSTIFTLYLGSFGLD